MKILVTGGLGFVGLNLVRDLAQMLPEGEVIAADLMTPDDQTARFLSPVAGRVQMARLDVRDRLAFLELVESRQITHIVHAAAVTPDLEQERSQTAFVVDVNLGGAVNALAAGMASPAVEQIILCSSSGVYGAPLPEQDGRLQGEEGRLALDNLYAITKYSAELLAARCVELSGKKIAALRLASVYGPMERGTGSRGGLSHVQRLHRAWQEKRPLRLAGAAICRDWVYTRDVSLGAACLIRSAQWRQVVYNLGSGQAIAFGEVAEAFAAYGLQVQWVDDPAQADVAMTPTSARAALDNSRLREDTGFTPAFSFQAGLADYLK